jgi:hypothetical protein
MPEEFQAPDWKYRIKSDEESFERNVLECDFSPSIVPDATYEPVSLGALAPFLWCWGPISHRSV